MIENVHVLCVENNLPSLIEQKSPLSNSSACSDRIACVSNLDVRKQIDFNEERGRLESFEIRSKATSSSSSAQGPKAKHFLFPDFSHFDSPGGERRREVDRRPHGAHRGRDLCFAGEVQTIECPLSSAPYRGL